MYTKNNILFRNKLFYFLNIVFIFGFYSVFGSSNESVLTNLFNKVSSSFNILLGKDSVVLFFFFVLYLSLIYIFYKSALSYASFLKNNSEKINKISLLLSLISTLALFYFGIRSSGNNLKKFLVVYLGLPGLLGLFVFSIFFILMYKSVFKIALGSKNNSMSKRSLFYGGYGVLISLISIMFIIYIEFLIGNIGG